MQGPDKIVPRSDPYPLMPPLTNTPCKHPQVRVVAREEDAEYVECQSCGEVFDSTEFRDMEIEEQPIEDAEA